MKKGFVNHKMTEFLLRTIVECQEIYNGSCAQILQTIPLLSDPDRYKSIKKELKKALRDPEKIDKIVEDYDLFNTNESKKWQSFLSFMNEVVPKNSIVVEMDKYISKQCPGCEMERKESNCKAYQNYLVAGKKRFSDSFAPLCEPCWFDFADDYCKICLLPMTLSISTRVGALAMKKTTLVTHSSKAGDEYICTGCI